MGWGRKIIVIIVIWIENHWSNDHWIRLPTLARSDLVLREKWVLKLVMVQLLNHRKTNAEDNALQIGAMEEITVILGFRWFQKFRTIDWFAACKAEHFGTFLARFADNPSQVLDIHVERGLVGE